MFVKHDFLAAAARLQSAIPFKRALFAAALTLVVAAPRAEAGPTLVMEVESGKVLHAVDAFEPWYAASLTKMMTAYLTLRALESGRTTPSTPISITEAARAEPPSKLGLPVGSGVEIQHALAVLMVKSANDIAISLADAVSGSVENFVRDMNKAAQDLGMTQTRFINPHGLPGEGQQTTAHDLAILARTLMRMNYPPGHPLHDLRRHLFHLHAVTLNNRRMNNTNGLIGRYPDATGLKTGFTCSAGYNVVATAERNGRQLIAVVLGARSGGQRTLIAASLLEQGFDQSPDAAFPVLDKLAPDVQPQLAPPDLRPLVCRARKQKVTAEERAAFNAVDPSIDLERGKRVLGGKVAAEDENDEAPTTNANASENGFPSGLVIAIKVYPPAGQAAPAEPAIAADDGEPKKAGRKSKISKKKVIGSKTKPTVAKSGGAVDLRAVGDVLSKKRPGEKPTGAGKGSGAQLKKPKASAGGTRKRKSDTAAAKDDGPTGSVAPKRSKASAKKKTKTKTVAGH